MLHLSYLVYSCSEGFVHRDLLQNFVKMLLVGSRISIEISHALLERFILAIAFKVALWRHELAVLSDVTFLLSIMLSRYVFEAAESGYLRVDVHVEEFWLLNTSFSEGTLSDLIVIHLHFLLIFLHTHAEGVPEDVSVDNFGFCKSI